MLKCFDTSYRDKVKRLLNVMLPIIGTQMAIIGMNFFDASMSGQAGDIDLAGAAIGGNIWMPVQTCVSGILMAAMLLALAFSVLVLAGGVAFLPHFLQGMGLEPAVYNVALWYMVGIGIGVIPFFLITPLRSLIDTLGYTHLTMKIYMLALPLNALLNYVLIFGKLGMRTSTEKASAKSRP